MSSSTIDEAYKKYEKLVQIENELAVKSCSDHIKEIYQLNYSQFIAHVERNGSTNFKLPLNINKCREALNKRLTVNHNIKNVIIFSDGKIQYCPIAVLTHLLY
jgi:hypothetical protein